MVEPGEYRMESMLKVVAASGVPLEIRPDAHFFCSREEFATWAKRHPQLRMEFFYREMRKKTGVLMERVNPWAASGTSIPKIGRVSEAAGRGCCLQMPRGFPPDGSQAR